MYNLTCILNPSSLPTAQPKARSALGCTNLRHGSLPHRVWASARPRTSPGTATERPPYLDLIGCSLYIDAFARAGPVSRKSIVQTSDLPPGTDGGNRTVINPPPPIPDLWNKLNERVHNGLPRYLREHVYDANTERGGHSGVHRVPTLLQYFDANLRTQLAFTRNCPMFDFDRVCWVSETIIHFVCGFRE